MPLVPYDPPFFLFNRHLETIFPALMRSVELPPYTRERIETPDGDFLDLDWLSRSRQIGGTGDVGMRPLLILSHGLEGDSQRPYIKGMAKAFLLQGFDVLAWNFRGCGLDMNRLLRFYHSGATEDLDLVVQHAIQQGYTQIDLVGFSLGGNLTLKYLGESALPPAVHRAAVFSVPLDLYDACLEISRRENWIYARRFLKSLKSKITRKATQMQGLDTSRLENIRTILEFDEYYTAPLHGFASALDYYERNSSIHFLDGIHVPTLIVNAVNDPFLGKNSFPMERLAKHASVTFECITRGGHVGFAQINKNGLYWSEERALQFILT
ncbi:alpha/beta fold hydrolase [Fulvivirgaceae bacterium PWU5]|uniref:Alpha/beta fold hydrolase n=1 Tax=Dawidia cretensis TaxID=2782350 RepID=A0AAP2DYP6_9BACT|nr:alpha/beta fold hydrolase [Dawidia cretensis]MBT1710075.1 alpha/beta fold hydrolase [Dawidia cretensis]